MEKYTVSSLAHFTLAARLQQLSVVAYCFSFQTAFSGQQSFSVLTLMTGCVLLDTECTPVYCWTQDCTPVYCWTQSVHLCTAGHKSVHLCTAGHRVYTCVLLDTKCTPVYCWTQSVHLCTAGHTRVYTCVLLDTDCTPVYCLSCCCCL